MVIYQLFIYPVSECLLQICLVRLFRMSVLSVTFCLLHVYPFCVCDICALISTLLRWPWPASKEECSMSIYIQPRMSYNICSSIYGMGSKKEWSMGERYQQTHRECYSTCIGMCCPTTCSYSIINCFQTLSPSSACKQSLITHEAYTVTARGLKYQRLVTSYV